MSDTIVVNSRISEYCLKIYRQYQKDGLNEDNSIQNAEQIPITSSASFQKDKSIHQNLNAIAEFSLHSNETLPILYAYRQVRLEIISRWTSSYDGSFQSLKDIVCALGRACGPAAESASLAEHFLSQHSETLFQQINNEFKNNTNTISISTYQDILLAFFRLMYHDRHRFQYFINYQVIYTSLENSTDSIIKYLCIEIICMYLDASESSRQQMISTHISEAEQLSGQYDNEDTSINYRFVGLIEAKRLSNFSKVTSLKIDFPFKSQKSNDFTIEPVNLSTKVVSICGVLVPKLFEGFRSAKNISYSSPDFVKTDNAVSVLEKLATNIQKNHPTMLYGNAGAGKTFLINEVAKRMSYEHSIVKIHLGEQTDAKLLLGTYASGEKPGTFQWRSGVLTTAVQQGRWVIIEDIDQAPTEVLSVLLTLLEKRELTIPSRGEVIKAKNGFQLISTIRSESDKLPDLIGLRLWSLVNVPSPEDSDLKNILHSRFPILGRLLPKIIACFNDIVKIYSTSSFVTLNRGAHPRVISFRDLMKLCSRCSSMLQSEGVTSTDGLLSQHIYDQIFAETIDCFGSAITEHAALIPLVNAIGERLEIPSSRINLYMTKHIPVFINNDSMLKVGRAMLPKHSSDRILASKTSSNSFARTNHSLRLMEQIGVSIQMMEPVLLVGETGTGKTTVVQQVAKMMNKKLTVINVSQQTESGDLLGGYKPVNTKTIAVPLQEIFETLFIASFSKKKNERFAQMLTKCFNKSQWKNVIKLWLEAIRMAKEVLEVKEEQIQEADGQSQKRRKLQPQEKSVLLEKWVDFEQRVHDFEVQSSTLDSSAFVFSFVEGSLVKAVRNGDWLLLDELNLASSDTLESIADLLTESAQQRSILLTERGDVESIVAHPDFRIFGCMNPSTDVGKRDLPLSIRSRFTELYVHSPDKDIQDLLSIIDQYIGRFAVADEWVGNDIAELYLCAKRLSEENKIVDGANQRPHFSIRTLTRTLTYVCDIVGIYGLRRSLYEAFSMSYLTLLNAKSESILRTEIVKYMLGRLKNAKSVLNQSPPSPGPGYVQFKHYWMRRGPGEIIPQPHYIITPFVEKNMLNLVRATAGRRFPVLIQGPTSAGKTSMIQYLANITGHEFVRINNHEHTDLQEYLGTYMSDSSGKLVFKEGILVEALRKGHWIVLDELNLAPTDVLEALNRLLDDNRELFIPETQEVIRPHPDFMLFATQNPPGLYGGRKMLSRAFRNRFLELHFDDIPQDELEIILRERCQIAPSYGKKIVEVYRQLSIQRQSTRLFEQKNSFATLRDLFRWAKRDAVGYEELAANGFMLLAERVRKAEEKQIVKETIEKVMRVKLDMDDFYSKLEIEANLPEIIEKSKDDSNAIVWTKAMRRLAVLVFTSMKYKEPLLLVGETGCGKTTVCQIIAKFLGKKLITVNAHQNTETGDILGAQRPVRHRFETQSLLWNNLMSLMNKLGVEVTLDDSKLDELLKVYDSLRERIQEDEKENILYSQLIQEIDEGRRNASVLFDWNDGPLVQAMKTGNFFLLDEISLADDSVLERLNSVLEPERTLLLAEKGNDDSFVTASEGFEFLATMNPGGDYGKKELSPALRNRFTEIWVPSMENFDDVRQIVAAKLECNISSELCEPLVQYSEWYGQRYGSGNASSGVISLRDILAWVQFINSVVSADSNFDKLFAFLNGAAMVFIDSLGTNNTAYLAENEQRLLQEKLVSIDKLSELVNKDMREYYTSSVAVKVNERKLTCGGFSLDIKFDAPGNQALSFNLDAPTTAANTMRVIRAMQVNKPILLEGSPGVGKTSLVSALAKATGNPLVRINLSEQTDLVDLFGSDAPAEGGKTGEFIWRDAPFLRAMQNGEWVLLDEMNLASQSVLEGLNACLDHRGSAYIPELDKTFEKHPDFVVFAAQNPQYQGGGRKGLPKSFVNRFSVVYVDVLKEEDLNLISQHLYPKVDKETSSKMIKYISRLEHEVSLKKSFGSVGGPWEFNLRDTLRWLDLYNTKGLATNLSPSEFLNMIVFQRFRSSDDRQKAQNLYLEVFEEEYLQHRDNYFAITESYIQAGGALISRNEPIQNTIASHGDQVSFRYPLQSNFVLLETAIRCINLKLPLILTGSTNSGKTELIRYLAESVGAQLDEFAMNSDVDSMDILGGYEQVEVERCVTSLALATRKILVSSVLANLKAQATAPAIMNQALEFIQFIDSRDDIQIDDFPHALHSRLESFSSVYNSTDLSNLLSSSKVLEKKVQESKANSVRFEWFDGLLVRAVEQGHWLVLDNANLCSPSVLDRLNSLLEVNGTLVINECSTVDGKPREVVPHPNFRLFLTVDPKYGELSRAMRNRGIEVFVLTLDERMTNFDRNMLTQSEQKESDSEDHGVPVSGFLPSQRSLERSFALVDDSIELSSKKNEELLNTLVSVIPFNLVQILPLWIELVQKSKEYNNITKELIQLFGSKYDEILLNDLTLRKLFKIYEPIQAEIADNILPSKENFLKNQSLLPLMNAYLNSLDTVISRSSEPLFFFEAITGNWDIARLLSKLEESAIGKKLGDLSYIERSAAFQLGRNIKKPPRLNIYKFILEVKEYIATAVRFRAFRDDVSLFDLSGNYFESLVQLQSILKCLLLTSGKQDESKLRVYQDLVRSWCEDTRNSVESKDALQRIVDSFADELTLTSGFSIAKIWERMRATYPTSGASWNQSEEILRLSSLFDLVASQQFKDANHAVQSLRSVIVNIYKDIQTYDSESPLSSEAFVSFCFDLESGINKLRDMSNEFIVKRDNVLKSEYILLTNLVESQGLMKKSENTASILADLKISSGRSTALDCLRENKLDDFSPYPVIFDSLWPASQGKFYSLVNGLFSNEVMLSTLYKCQRLGNGAGKYLEQNLDDISSFRSALVTSSEAVMEKRSRIFSHLLFNWIIEIVNIHIEEESQKLQGCETTLASVQSIIEQVKSISIDVRILQVFEKFFFPSLFMVASSTENNLEILGKAWVLFACGSVQLYVPTSAYDPAISDYILFDNFQRHQKDAESLIDSWKITRSVISGDEQIDAETIIESAMQKSIDSKKSEKPKVYRPDASIDSLFEEWSAFLTSTIDVRPIEDLLKAAQDLEDLDKSQGLLNMFQANSSQFLLRLSQNYTVYGDLNDILKGFVYGMKLGFDLISLQNTRTPSKYSGVSSAWSTDTTELTSPKKVVHNFNLIKEFAKSFSVDSVIPEKIMIFFIRLCFSHKAAGMISSEVDGGIDSVFEQSFQSLYYRWSLRRMKKDELEAAQGNLYKYTDPTSDLEGDFKEMFPDYEEVMDSSFETSKLNNAESVYEELYSDISQLYVSSFSNPEASHFELPALIKEGNKVHSLLFDFMADFSKDSAPGTLNSLISSMNYTLDAFKDSQDKTNLDFYRGASPSESKRSIAVIKQLVISNSKLLVQWPEHATLQNISRICDEYLSFPIDTPLARLLQKIEQIYTYVAEWEKYASSQVSLKVHFDVLTQLIVSWRKLELSTWKALFVFEDSAVEKSLGRWWFYLFETIIIPELSNIDEEGENSETKLISALNVFIGQATYGDFEKRLDLINAFGNHVKIIKGANYVVYESLCNFITFYKQFVPIVNNNVTKQRKSLEKDVSEVILLASWKDVNIDALKQSARRSHNNLYKIVRKYRALLSIPVTSIIESGISMEEKVVVSKEIAVSENISEEWGISGNDINMLVTTVSTWSERPQRLQNLNTVSSNMQVYISRIAEDSVPSLSDYAGEILQEMDRLRNETPKELKKDNKKLIATLLTQKRKLLSDTLKELRRMGLKTSLRSDILKMQESVTMLICNSKSFEESKMLKGCDAYYYRILDLLPRLRASVSGGLSEGVPQSDADKGLAAAENLIFSLTSTRKPLVQLSTSLREIEERAALMSKLSNSVLSRKVSMIKGSIRESVTVNINTVKHCLHWLQKLIDFAIENVQAVNQFSETDSAGLDTFYSMKLKLSEFSVKLRNIDSIDNLITAVDDETSMIEEFKDFTENHMIVELQAWKSQSGHEKLSYIADSILDWFSIQNYEIIHEFKTREDDLHVEQVEGELRDLSNAIILCVQKVMSEKGDGEPIKEEDENWLSLSQQKMIAFTKALHHRKIAQKIQRVLRIASEVEHNVETSKLSAALFAFTIPIIKKYLQLANVILTKVRRNYVETSKGAFLLSSSLYLLATKGFCSPEPPTEQKDDNNLQEGTGLGDGEGATNNSKDVEEDEDLTEDAQQPNEENKEKDDGEEEDNNDAVDIEGDMAGELENASDQEDDDEGDDKDDEEDNELDEEIDDLDDLDPNAIDDKMWDEEAQENSKEKDSEKMPDNANKDEDNMEANEDDDVENKNKQTQDQQNPDEEEQDDKEEEDNEGDDEDNEKDVGEQEDEVKNEENEQLEDHVPESEALDLPDDLNLDSGDEKSDAEADDEDGEGFEDKMDVDQNEEKNDNEDEDEGLEEINEDTNMEEGEESSKEEEGEEEGEEEEQPESGETNADVNEDEGMESEEEALGEKDEESKEDESGGNNDESAKDEQKAEGVDGANDEAANDEVDVETAVKQESGERGEGADNQVSEENNDVGATGGASSDAQQDMKKEEEKQKNEDARDMARESLKQLGDSLKEFHRRRQEIQEASTREEEKKDDNKGANERPDEFEHLEGENADFDTQALGSAEKDQVQSVDDDMAIDDEMEETKVKEEEDEEDGVEDKDSNEEEPTEEEEAKEEDETSEKPQDDGDFEGQTAGNGNKNDDKDVKDESFDLANNDPQMELDSEEDNDEEELEVDIGKMDLNVPPIDIIEARELWKNSELATQELASGLCEQLRLILEPTLATKLRGDYKTGKRLNMKRIIPYIASDFRKDKIWLRRTKPSKRQYQIMIAIDDSKSMSESKSTELAFHSIALVSKALTQLESGGLSIVRFGEDVKVVHPFDRPFNNQESGAKIFQWFDFKQTKTDITNLCKQSLKIFEDAKATTSSDLWQLQIILSDGVCEDHQTVQRLVRRAREQKIMLVFVVIDGINSNESILDMSQVNYETDPSTGTSNLKVTKYLDTFPFEFYVIVRNINELPEMLSLILRQYFSEMASV